MYTRKPLSFAVVYPNGKMNPTTEDGIYADSTLIYWENLKNLGFIRVGVNEVYEVEKITYTMGERENHGSQSNWGPNDSIDWEKKRVELPELLGMTRLSAGMSLMAQSR